MMAFFNGKKRSKLLMVTILVMALVVTYAIPMTVFATETGEPGDGTQFVEGSGDLGGDDSGDGDLGDGEGDLGGDDSGDGDLSDGEGDLDGDDSDDEGLGDDEGGLGGDDSGEGGSGEAEGGLGGDGSGDGLTPEEFNVKTFVYQPQYGIKLEKSVNKEKASPGDTVTYTFKVTNTGNSNLSNVMLTDELLDKEWEVGFLGTYGFNKSKTYTVEYTIPDDTVLGDLTNVATVTGDNGWSGDWKVEVSDTGSAVVEIIPEYGIKLEKTVDEETSYPGGKVTYTFKVTNTGKEPLKNVKLSDELLGLDYMIGDLGTTGKSKRWTDEFQYTIPGSAGLGELKNEATVTGDNGLEGDDRKEVSASDDAVVKIIPEFGIKLEKTANKASASPGDDVTYTFKVTNTGAKDLKHVTIKDPMFDNWFGEWFIYIGNLNKGKDTTRSYTYEIPDDKALGEMTNTAMVTGKDKYFDGNVVATHTDDALVNIIPKYAISLDKSVSPGTASPGDEVTYTFIITNTGSRDLDDVVLTDELLGSDWRQEIEELESGESETFTAVHEIPTDTLVDTDYVNKAEVVAEYKVWHDGYWWHGIWIPKRWSEDKQISEESSATVRIVDEITPAETVKFFVRTVGERPTEQGGQPSANFTSVLATIYITDPAISLSAGNSHVNEFPEDTVKGALDPAVENAVQDWADLDDSGYDDLIDSIMAQLQNGVYNDFLAQFSDQNWYIDWYDLKWENDAWHVDGDIRIKQDQEEPGGDDGGDDGGGTGGGGGGGGGGGSTPIDEEPVPASPVTPAAIDNGEQMILNEEIPAGPLPQTGGVPSLLLYGLGALLAGGGATLRLRNRKKDEE